MIRELLAVPPRAGEGVHAWLFRVARQLHAHLPAGEFVQLLEYRVADGGRAVPRNEVVAAVQNLLPGALPASSRSTCISTREVKWPKVIQERRAAIIRDGGGLADFGKFLRFALKTASNTRRKSLTNFFRATRFFAVASRNRNSTQGRVEIGAVKWRNCN